MNHIGRWLVENYRRLRLICGKPGVSPERRKAFGLLYPGENAEALREIHDRKLAMQLFSLSVVLACLTVLMLWSRFHPQRITSLERPSAGETEREEQVLVKRENGSSEAVDLTVLPKELREEALEEEFQKAFEEFLQYMPGENESLEHVTEPLELRAVTEDGLVRAEWTSLSRELLDDWGEIKKERADISAKGEDGAYELKLFCGNEIREYEIRLTVFPMELTEEECFSEELQLLSGNSEGEALSLPEEYHGEKLTWYRAGASRIWLYPVFVLAALFLLPVRDRQREKEALEKRRKELIRQYPELLSEFTVLLQAGMTERNAWLHMVSGYERKGGRKRFVYEEMAITARQLKMGYPEAAAYREFGERCGLAEYRRFTALLSQNIRQGGGSLGKLLREEIETAYEKRKNTARGLGEEAQSKLLFPMVINLCIVLIIVMVPAFMKL